MNTIRIQRRVRTILLLLALVAVTVVSLPQSPVGAATSCTATPQNGSVMLSWPDEGARYIVRRDGNWLATPGRRASSYLDTSPTAGATYELVVRQNDTVDTITCVEGPLPPAPGQVGCALTQQAGNVTLTWADTGGKHVVRRNGKWRATPGFGASSYTDTSPVDGATYLIRTIGAGTSTDRVCAVGGNTGVGDRRFVIHVSIDGLRADGVTFAKMPTLNRLANQGASTMNARPDPAVTKTLPNHTSQFTGRYVWGPNGHRVTFNEDNLSTLHATAGGYVSSIFDVVHDNGGRTVLYNGKSKFDFIERSYDANNGAPDTTGVDNGRDKIDVFVKEDPALAPPIFVDDLVAGAGDTYGFFHIRTPDEFGHSNGWNSPEYIDALGTSDDILAELIDRLDAAGALENATILVTADHGGPTGGTNHSGSGNPDNYTVPFVAWGVDVASGADMYALNPQLTDPGTRRPLRGDPQPIRGHDAPNLALELLGLPAIANSVVNADQSFNVN